MFSYKPAVAESAVIGEHLLARGLAEDLVGVERAVPFVEVFGGRIQGSISALDGPIEIWSILDVGQADRHVTRGAIGDQLVGSRIVSSIAHPERPENIFREEVAISLAGEFLNNECQQVVVGVGVTETGAGRELKWLVFEKIDDSDQSQGGFRFL